MKPKKQEGFKIENLTAISCSNHHCTCAGNDRGRFGGEMSFDPVNCVIAVISVACIVLLLHRN